MWHQLTAWLSSLPGGLSALGVSAVIVLWIILASALASAIGNWIAGKDRERERAFRAYAAAKVVVWDAAWARLLAALRNRIRVSDVPVVRPRDTRVGEAPLRERIRADVEGRRHQAWGRGGVSQSGTGSARRRSDHHAPHEESGMRTTRLSLNPKDAA